MGEAETKKIHINQRKEEKMRVGKAHKEADGKKEEGKRANFPP